MIPKARIIALLADPTDRVIFENTTRGVKAAAESLGLALHVAPTVIWMQLSQN